MEVKSEIPWFLFLKKFFGQATRLAGMLVPQPGMEPGP